MDSFDHLEEQERSIAYGERFGSELAREAARRWAADPTVPLAGVIAEDGALNLGRTARRRRRPLGEFGPVGIVDVTTMEEVRGLAASHGAAVL